MQLCNYIPVLYHISIDTEQKWQAGLRSVDKCDSYPRKVPAKNCREKAVVKFISERVLGANSSFFFSADAESQVLSWIWMAPNSSGDQNAPLHQTWLHVQTVKFEALKLSESIEPGNKCIKSSEKASHWNCIGARVKTRRTRARFCLSPAGQREFMSFSHEKMVKEWRESVLSLLRAIGVESLPF